LRKLLVSTTCAGLLAAPAALAFADSDNAETIDLSTRPTLFPVGQAQPLERAQEHAHKTADNVADRTERLSELAQARREARLAAAEEAQAETETAPEPAHESGGSGGAASGQLEQIAQCESGGDPSAVGGGGAYGGKYQFDQSTWQSVGGSGDPASAPEAEQDKRAAMLLEQSGTNPWPNCG
jgi:hypothetical protein